MNKMVEAITICSNTSVNPAFERLLLIANETSARLPGQMATIVKGDQHTLRHPKQIQHRLKPEEIDQLVDAYKAGVPVKDIAD